MKRVASKRKKSSRPPPRADGRRKKGRSTPTRRSRAQDSGASDTFWPLSLKLNGKEIRRRVSASQTLLDFLRLELGLTGTKGACLEGECGSCYVLVDGRPMNSCLMLAPQVQDRAVMTIEGIAQGGRLDIIQQKFIECGAVQCGYCTPGLIMAARALLDQNPHPTRAEFLVGMEGNICRCTGYSKIMRALEEAADAIAQR